MQVKENKTAQITDIMQIDVVTVEKGTSVMDAVRKLVRHNITGLPVVDDKNRVIGVISEKDVLGLAIQINEKSYVSDQSSLLVEEFMTKEVVTVEGTETLTTLCMCLMKNKFRRTQIVLGDKLVGIVSRKDIISLILPIED